MKLISLFAFLVSASAFAAAPDSIYTFKPAVGNHNVDFKPAIYDSQKADLKVNGTKTGDLEISNNLYAFEYMYTMSDTMTWGARTAFGTYKVKTTTESKNTGMTDLFLTYGGRSAMSSGTLHWDADLGISPSKGKESNASNDGNLYSGGMSLTPSVSWVAAAGSSMSWGVTGRYQYLMERKLDSTTAGVENTYTGGNALTLMPFIEMPFTDGRGGAYLRYTSTGELKQKAGAAAETAYRGAYTTLALGGSVAYSFSERFAGLADLEYATNTDFQASTAVDKGTLTGLNLTLGARATF